MTTIWFSLKRRLLALLLGGVSAIWLATMIFSYVDAHREVDKLFDAQLAQSAQVLLALASHEEDDEIEDMGEIAHKYQRRLRFQLWNAEGRLMMRSSNAPETPMSSSDGFSEESGLGSARWRHYTQWNTEHTLQIQVSENHHIRDDLIGHIASRLILPALFGLPLIGLWVWLATRRGLASLDELARDIAGRDPQQLQPLSPASAPSEIRPMLEAINGLFERVDKTLEAERRFTADAAHELRTPLAALLAQLQVAQGARDEPERLQSLARMDEGLHRAARLVEQMLQLARLDPESGLPEPQPVDLVALAESVCADLGPAILARNIDFALEAPASARVTGQADWLRVLMRNLLDNAIRYTPAGGKIVVRICSTGERIELEVADNGPGIPAAEREAVLQRFHRLHQDKQPGSGLGLAIVARIAELHRASLCLSDATPQGLKVRLDFLPA